MVLNIWGYDPNEVGLRQFLGEPELEVLECLWEKGTSVESSRLLKDCRDGKGKRHSAATINNSLKSLRERGVVASRVVAHSVPHTEYYAVVMRKELPALLIGQLLDALSNTMPEEFSKAVKRL